ncbi:MAG: S8 family serine peptidase [Thermoleophilia bacterium]|nr:S8 family serine peptidase [Thermoleophilia bacterium]
MALVATAMMLLAIAGAFYIVQLSGEMDAPEYTADSGGVMTPGPEGAGIVPPSGSSGQPESDISVNNTGADPAVEGAASIAVPPAKTSAKIQATVVELAATRFEAGPESAAEYASLHGLELKDDKVKVVIEAAPGQSTPNAAASSATISAGATIDTTYGDLIQALVPLESLQQLAEDPSVSYIREPKRPTVFTTTEGVADIGASAWQGAGNNGAGAKVAVLDPGFSGYSQLVSAGELPAGVIIRSFTGDITGGGEIHGAACAEIVYDTAPGAQLYLVNFSTDVELGNAVDYLITQGVDVVSASWGFYGSFRGDGQGDIDDMVQSANAAGIFWANASGNAGQTHWSGSFTDSNSDSWHQFSGSDTSNDVSASAGNTIDLFLTWNRWPLTDQDYDMYLYWSGNPNTAVAAGDAWQNGSYPPSEEIHYTVPTGKDGTYYLKIKNFSATGDAVFNLYSYPAQFQYQVAAGSLGGQPTDSAYAAIIGAVPVGGTTIESFSSRGPTIDGRVKPDLVAPDRVSTVTYGAQGFWGTSAAAPHAAGAAALVKGSDPTLTPASIQALLESRATALGAAGKDNIYGSGKLNLGSVPDHTAPIVTSVQPGGTIDYSSGAVVVYYMDANSGINQASVQVALDGAPLAGCTVTTAQASCPFSGLAQGSHSVSGTVSDNAGNASPISGSFIVAVACVKPLLSLGAPSSFWATYTDYTMRELSVTFPVSNTGYNNAININIIASLNTNSAILSTAVPMGLGSLDSINGTTTSTNVTLKYLVPIGVPGFRATLFATAEDVCATTYTYPSPYIDV